MVSGKMLIHSRLTGSSPSAFGAYDKWADISQNRTGKCKADSK